MDRIKVTGGKKLSGKVYASGAKNSALPILFATLLAEGKNQLLNVPDLADIHSTSNLLQTLGCSIEFKNNTYTINRPKKIETLAPYDLVRKMRASILCLGPLVAVEKKAQVSLPGGCAIGARPINFHLEALKKLGAQIRLEEGYVFAECKQLRGDRVIFDIPTVGGTENILMAATLAKGETSIENAAREPEISDLADCLRGMGAKIEGDGTSIIRVQGVDKLQPAHHTIIADRIEVGTLLICAGLTFGKVKVTKCNPEHLKSFLDKLSETGIKIQSGKDWIEADASHLKLLKSVNIVTAPYPGFPTDLQAQFMTLMCVTEGTSQIQETIFENRFMHVPELVRMGANIQTHLNTATIIGKTKSFQPATVMATDLRASASLILAGLSAVGVTKVKRIYHLDRGYEKLENKLTALGAEVTREKDE
jgi:UDP-N-acetylglucosamine 1-carboxyvinyltransferase